MKETKFKLKRPDKDDVWEETDLVPDGVEPQVHFENLIKKFNEEEDHRHKMHTKYQPDYRELVSVGDVTGVEKDFCTFNKINTFTISRGDSSYDLMQCSKCKLILRRFGLGQGFNYERRECRPDLLCTKCNKQYKSTKYLATHNEKGNHNTQVWYPDGI